MTSVTPEDDRLQRKRHAAKLRQRRCREKKRMSVSVQTTADSRTTSRHRDNSDKNESKNVFTSSPTTTMDPFHHHHHSHHSSMMQGIPFPRLGAPQYHPSLRERHEWERHYHHHYHHHRHAHAAAAHIAYNSPYAAPRPSHPHPPSHYMETQHSPSVIVSNKQCIIVSDPITSDECSSSSHSQSSSIASRLDTQEAAAIDAMLSLVRGSKTVVSDAEETASLVSSDSCSSDTEGTFEESSSSSWSNESRAMTMYV
jgi:hypothetical protein